MTGFLKVIGLLTVVLHCNGQFLRRQSNRHDAKPVFRLKTGRRFGFPQGSVIIGAPSYPNHLPEAEAILPGHTLLRPGFGMLKSAVKYPHRELEFGSGVYGNWDNLGIRYDGKNERVLYTGFRRSNSNNIPIVVLNHCSTELRDASVHPTNFCSTPFGNSKKKIDDFEYLPPKSGSHKTNAGRDTQNDFFSRIQDLISAEKYRYSKSILENEYSSEEIRQSEQADEGTNLLSLMEMKPKLQYLNQKGMNQVIEKNPVSWNLNYLLQKNDNYLKRLIESIQRRNKVEDKQKNRKQNSLNKKFDHDKDKHNEFKIPNVSSNVKVLNPTESDSSSSSSEDIPIDITVPTGKTKEERKREWFWSTKDWGNHIKINPKALEYKEFLPESPKPNEMEDIRSWWYFNQADHKHLQEDEQRRHH